MFIDKNTNVKMLCLFWCLNLGSLVYKRNALPKFNEGGGHPSIQVSTKRLVLADICEFQIGLKTVKSSKPYPVKQKCIQYSSHKVYCSCLSTGLDYLLYFDN